MVVDTKIYKKNMTKLNFFLVTYDLLSEKSISQVENDFLSLIKCYAVVPDVPKIITNKVEVINEWDLMWYDKTFQENQFFEYSAIAHLYKNPKYIEGLTHIGLLHSDVLFPEGYLGKLLESLDMNPQKILYNRKLKKEHLYMTENQHHNISKFMSDRLDMNIDSSKIWNGEWVSEALSIVPIDIFLKFGEFLVNYKQEIENILLFNKWGVMDTTNHRICGFVERMWGGYLVSHDLSFEKMLIVHDHDSYFHAHDNMKNWIKK
jgi:hypothetical protein